MAFMTEWGVEKTKNGDSFCATCVPVRTVTLSKDPVCAIQISKSGANIAVGGNSGDLVVFEASTMTKIRLKKEAHLLPITGIAFSPRIANAEAPDLVLSGSADQALWFMVVKPDGGLSMAVVSALVLLVAVILGFIFMQ
jgi:prolactin regulatory element-binding protein